jgi:hypothetical protein
VAIGSAIERGSLICVYDERGTALFQKVRGSGPRTGCWDSQVPPSPPDTAKLIWWTYSVRRSYSKLRVKHPRSSAAIVFRGSSCG